MSVLEEIRAKAKALHRTVILPEGNEDRTLKAAQMLVSGGMADVILVEDEASIRSQRGPAGRRPDRRADRGSEDVTQGSRVCHSHL